MSRPPPSSQPESALSSIGISESRTTADWMCHTKPQASHGEMHVRVWPRCDLETKTVFAGGALKLSAPPTLRQHPPRVDYRARLGRHLPPILHYDVRRGFMSLRVTIAHSVGCNRRFRAQGLGAKMKMCGYICQYWFDAGQDVGVPQCTAWRTLGLVRKFLGGFCLWRQEPMTVEWRVRSDGLEEVGTIY
jgi:hypothetical protein